MPKHPFLRQCELIFALALTLSAGCVKTEHPLREAGKIVTDSELAGDWIQSDPIWGEDGSKGMSIKLVGSDTYRITALGDDVKDSIDAKLVEINGKAYFDPEAVVIDEIPQEIGFLPGFVQVERKGDWIALRTPDPRAFRRHIKAATEISGTVDGDGLFCSVTINSSANDLSKFLAKHSDEVLSVRQVFRRIDQH